MNYYHVELMGKRGTIFEITRKIIQNKDAWEIEKKIEEKNEEQR